MKMHHVLGVALTLLLAACGGGTSGSNSNGALPTQPAQPQPTQPQPTQPQPGQLVHTKQFTVTGSGNAPAVTVVQISVSGLMSSGGVTVTKDGAVWWSSLQTPTFSGLMVRLSPGFLVKTVPVNGSNIFGSQPDRAMAASPNGFAWGTFDGMIPIQNTAFLEIVAAAATSSLTGLPGVPPYPALSSVATPFLATGPDGNIWYVTQPAFNGMSLFFGGIGYVSETNDANVFAATPSVNDYLTAVGVGPDNKLWAGGKINGGTSVGFYRYSTSQSLLSSLLLTKPLSEIDAEVTGPDHALWFTDAADNLIGRITTGGVLTTFTVPTAGAKPLDITVGGDGALWFTENGAGKVARITTSGAITEYPLPSGNTAPVQITGPLTSPGCGNAQLWLASNGNILELLIQT